MYCATASRFINVVSRGGINGEERSEGVKNLVSLLPRMRERFPICLKQFMRFYSQVRYYSAVKILLSVVGTLVTLKVQFLFNDGGVTKMAFPEHRSMTTGIG